ncbi:aminotransferase class IV [Empedobacter sedimenti]|uniref:aminotransferase class IV n=1 Tax=Empedobacter sedimenti TaxID=3042610 RepID=UPI0024A6F3DF|nr:aminotransferase class IV [Empedobacter sedimenti]
MKINLSGVITEQADAVVSINNRAFRNGDAVKEVLRFVNGEIIDWEDHYFNLMASMRIYRMNIPLDFTPEFFQEQINSLAEANQTKSGKVEFFAFRNDEDDYLKASINFVVSIQNSANNWEFLSGENEIDVYKDYAVNTAFYSLVNTFRPEENIAEIYRLENEYEDIILLNSNKRMARSLKGNIFVINDQTIRTPKKEEGVITSVLRTNFIKKVNDSEDFKIEEADIFPFEIQKAEEVFILIDGVGILPITQNRKKVYTTEKTKSVFNYL